MNVHEALAVVSRLRNKEHSIAVWNLFGSWISDHDPLPGSYYFSIWHNIMSKEFSIHIFGRGMRSNECLLLLVCVVFAVSSEYNLVCSARFCRDASDMPCVICCCCRQSTELSLLACLHSAEPWKLFYCIFIYIVRFHHLLFVTIFVHCMLRIDRFRSGCHHVM